MERDVAKMGNHTGSMINGVKFRGGAFLEDTRINFFTKESKRICVIFGRNGSGKSTIARALKKALGQQEEGIKEAVLCNKRGEIITSINGDSRENTAIFDETYIRVNVQFREHGLKTIVMFGRQGDIDKEIQKAEKDRDELVRAVERADSIFQKYLDEVSDLSPEYYKKQIKGKLMGDGHWADRERLIGEKKANASVTEERWQTIGNLVPEHTKEQADIEYRRNMSLLDSIRMAGEPLPEFSFPGTAIAGKEKLIKKLLATRFERPELSTRERFLLSLAEKQKTQQLMDMKRIFVDEKQDFCPFCLQPVSSAYRNELAEEIQKILSRDVENHITDLQQVFLPEIKFSMAAIRGKLPENLVGKWADAVDGMNQEIAVCNRYIEQKKNNPYEPLMNLDINLENKAKQLAAIWEELETARKKYNESFRNKKALQQKLRALNAEMAHYEIQELYEAYQRQCDHQKQAEEERRSVKGQLNHCNQRIEQLNQAKRSVRIAAELMNRYLRYIFCAMHRLEIRPEQDEYCLYSNGQPVRPAEVSVGERNILALCYFFAEQFDHTDVEWCYKKPMFLLLDDPVSSFDAENHIGVLSFLCVQMRKILEGNSASRIVILTHDLSVMYYLNTISKTLGGVEAQELVNRKLEGFCGKDRQEYSELLKIVFNYAQAQGDSNELVIGNVMRRVLEAFSTFSYRCGMSDLTKENILEILPEKKYADYFRNLMYRLVLDGESHMQDRVRTGNGPAFFTELSIEEKRRIAKDVLCFMYLLNQKHLVTHLEACGNKQAEAVLQGWCRQISDMMS